MQFVEYGSEHSETIVLIHGGGLSWWNYREEAEALQDRFRVILPVLDGHAGSDRPFTTIENNAEEIISFLEERLPRPVSLIGGLSLGAQVTLEILSRRGDLCRHALIESAAVLPSRLTNALIGPAFAMSYDWIRNRSFARLQFRALHMKESLFPDYYRDTCEIARDDMIAFMKANTSYTLKESLGRTSAGIHVYLGERETREIRKSAELLSREVPGCSLTVLPGLYHGEFSLNHADAYVRALEEILGS